jgi:hypothetical protein
MTRDKENCLWRQIKEGLSPRDAIRVMVNRGIIQSHKEAWRTLEKWAKKGIYGYGVSLDLGWIEGDL